MRVFLIKNYFFYFLSLGEIQAVGGWWLRYTPEKLLNFIDFAHEPILPNWRKNISLPRRPYVFEVHRYNTPTCPTCIIHQIVLFSSIFIQIMSSEDWTVSWAIASYSNKSSISISLHGNLENSPGATIWVLLSDVNCSEIHEVKWNS